MDYFALPPDDPADDWKKGQSESPAGSDPHWDGFCEKDAPFEKPLDPHQPFEIISTSGIHTDLCNQINARFRELNFQNGMVHDPLLFMQLFISMKSVLIIQRAFEHGNPLVVAHRFAENKGKQS